MERIDIRAARPLEIVSRSSRVNVRGLRVRSGGAIPPRTRTTPWIVPGFRFSALAIALRDSPARHRRQSSRVSKGSNLRGVAFKIVFQGFGNIAVLHPPFEFTVAFFVRDRS